MDVAAERGYLADSDHNAIMLIDLKDGRLIQTIQLTKGAPAGLTLISSRHRLYAISIFNDQLLVVDTRLRAQIGTIEVGRYPRAVAVDEQAGVAYVSHLVTPDTIAVIDVSSDQVTATIALDDAGQGIAVDSTTRTLYVALQHGGVATYDLAKAQPGPTLTMPGELAGLGIDPAAKAVAVAVSTMTGEVLISR